MILSLTESYLTDLFTQFNIRLHSTVKIHKATDDNDFAELPASQAQINYMAFISNLRLEQREMQNIFLASNRIDFIFAINHKDNTIYALSFDRYITEFTKMIMANRQYKNTSITTAKSIIDVYDIEATNTDKFEDEYYLPSITFTTRIYDRDNSTIILKSDSV